MSQQYELQLKRCTPIHGQKYKVLELTDFLMHTTKHPQTKSVGRKVAKAFRNDKPGRIYSPTTGDIGKDWSAFAENLQKDPSFIEYVRQEEAKGYKVVLQLPKQGVPLDFGSDTKEFLKSKNGKRLLRRLAKERSG